ncbi:uncharacterized protein MYCFIDRAFT_182581 [Pseudocercospora fijiensis CIRAD86]|uniref:Uncharacterized protein n=1 Tax=Pseudocercospora fijiensis (strain CIRAD86) TaxID=383855 RepID=M2YY85_PSEFD|nr:uncharacterized protein MYCFIDRAFT_182581 [Pseudocercospora fijiensis CIRAD86]EME82620.1 hypothetical protein MYCFIDRAFT_182581 [Pseudocercospora fijiensis CIRAD86]
MWAGSFGSHAQQPVQAPPSVAAQHLCAQPDDLSILDHLPLPFGSLLGPAAFGPGAGDFGAGAGDVGGPGADDFGPGAGDVGPGVFAGAFGAPAIANSSRGINPSRRK